MFEIIFCILAVIVLLVSIFLTVLHPLLYMIKGSLETQKEADRYFYCGIIFNILYIIFVVSLYFKLFSSPLV